MRFSSYALPALAANLATALARPQDIDLDMVVAAPDPTFSEAVGVAAQTVTYDTASLIASATAAISSVSVAVSDVLSQTAVATNARRAVATTCAPQPAGATSAPTYAPADDNVSNFKANPYYSSVAANAPIPSGYTQAFVAQQASNNAFGYMGFDTFNDYNVNTCAQRCTNKYGCVSFNIYFERDPSVNPDDSSCSDPASVTMIKCVYWGGQVTQDNAQNFGQPRGNFKVAIAGSNGYVTTQISTPAGYQNGVPFGKFAINAPYDAQGYNTYMGAKIFTGTWDVSQCSKYCDAQTQYNIATKPKDGTPAKVCKFFNTYLLQVKFANGTVAPQGQYCSLYTEVWPIKYATNGGQWRGQDQYTVDYSFGYPANPSSSDVDPTVGDTTGAVYQARQDMTYSPSSLTAVFQPFCSSLLGYSVPVASATALTTTTPVVTSTVFSTTTAAANVKRQARSLSTPAVLTKYPASIFSSACKLIATSPTVTSTTTVATSTVTAATSTTTVVSVSTAPPGVNLRCDPLVAYQGSFNNGGCSGNTNAYGYQGCYCNQGSDGNAYCVDDLGSFNGCSTDADCPSGEFCDTSLGGVCDSGKNCFSSYVPGSAARRDLPGSAGMPRLDRMPQKRANVVVGPNALAVLSMVQAGSLPTNLPQTKAAIMSSLASQVAAAQSTASA